MVQGPAAYHHQIADAFFPQADAVFDDATTLDTIIDMLDPQPTLVERLICHLLLQCQLLAPGFLRGHEDLHVGQREGQETQILQEPAPGRQGIRRGVHNGLIMGAAAIRVTEKKDEEQRID